MCLISRQFFFLKKVRKSCIGGAFNIIKIGFDSFEHQKYSTTAKGLTDTLCIDGVDLEFICDQQVPPVTPFDVQAKLDLSIVNIWELDSNLRGVVVASDRYVTERHRVRKRPTSKFSWLFGFKNQNLFFFFHFF
ncbi:unnamed protein product [Rhizopus stolonifer]